MMGVSPAWPLMMMAMLVNNGGRATGFLKTSSMSEGERFMGARNRGRPRFIDEEIEVRFEKQPGPPVAFTWGDREYMIEEILERRRRLDFRRAWWSRRHRDYYTVRVHTGRVFELYFHRGVGRRHWVLFRELHG